jgi:hypothetical protein
MRDQPLPDQMAYQSAACGSSHPLAYVTKKSRNDVRRGATFRGLNHHASHRFTHSAVQPVLA